MSTQPIIQKLLSDADSIEAELERERQDFERQQESKRKDIDDMRTAARVLEKLEQTTNPKPLPPEKLAALQERGRTGAGAQPTFIDVVATAVQGIDSTITTAKVFETLKAQNIPMGDDPRTKISTALVRLEKRGALVKVVEGSIGRAHAYEKAAK